MIGLWKIVGPASWILAISLDSDIVITSNSEFLFRTIGQVLFMLYIPASEKKTNPTYWIMAGFFLFTIHHSCTRGIQLTNTCGQIHSTSDVFLIHFWRFLVKNALIWLVRLWQQWKHSEEHRVSRLSLHLFAKLFIKTNTSVIVAV